MLCCLPLGVTGALKACEAADQAKSDDDAEYKRKICLSKASSLIGIGLGLLLITSITAKSVAAVAVYYLFETMKICLNLT